MSKADEQKDIDFDEETTEEQEEREEIDQETAKLREKIEATEEKWKLALAEVENIRRIAKRDIGNAHKYALKPFIESLLPVLDSLEQGMIAAAEHEAVVEGMNLTYKMMLDVLKKQGAEQVDPIGKPFDPDQHEAITMQESQEVEPNTVLAVVQKGYILNGRVVRAARVVVAKN
jgi:molecular chaperone GrpE